jgi:putative flavoprotein involved in K+ transport
MRTLESLVIGAGHAGLAMSRCLTDRGIDHIVLERGRVAERWRSERWNSLRLLTPNWQSRLPGFRYDGPDPDGYMTMPEVIGYFERYATSFRAPVECGVEVRSVSQSDDAFLVRTSAGSRQVASVVIATGHAQLPAVPALAAELPRALAQLTPSRYKSAADVSEGGVLVVGASASGVQLADELQRAGRRVTIAVGHHTRLPRVYRGRDILWWLDRMGVLDEGVEDVYDVETSREQPSLQLIGHPQRITLDLAGLRKSGVRVVGRLAGANGFDVHFADDLVTTTAAADVKLASLLHRIDSYIAVNKLDAGPAPAFTPHCLTFVGAPTRLSLRAEGIGTIIWATGYRRDYPWLRVPVLNRRGEIRHRDGITDVPGLYAIGLPFLRRRNSSFIDGVGADAAALSEHLAQHLRYTAQSHTRSGAA